MKRNLALTYVGALVILVVVNFTLPRLMPGDPLTAVFGEEALVNMTAEMQNELAKRFALNKPVGDQFTAYVCSLLRGDLGYSYYFSAPVGAVIFGVLPWTMLLVGLAIILSTGMGFLLGIESGFRRGRKMDRFLLWSTMMTAGFPDYFVGILLLLFFGVGLKVAPLSGAVTAYSDLSGVALVLDILRHLYLPLAALVAVRVPATYLLTRNTVVSTLGDPFILTARAKGCTEGSIKYLHMGRNSLLPVITSTGLQLANIMTGAVFIEIVFAYPGMGSLLQIALFSRDYPLMQGIMLTLAVIILTVNFLLEILYTKVDPRIGHAH